MNARAKLPEIMGWQQECAEWNAIAKEMTAAGGSPRATDVTAAQVERMVARGQRPMTTEEVQADLARGPRSREVVPL
jgi:hypothetical protein